MEPEKDTLRVPLESLTGEQGSIAAARSCEQQ
jgi:hypothetical protein